MDYGKDYQFVVSDQYKSDTTPIRLLTEAYNGIVYCYKSVSIKEESDGTARVKFGYEILDSGKWKEDKLRGDRYFEEHLGLILNTLIIDTMEIENADGEGYSEEFDEDGEVQP